MTVTALGATPAFRQVDEAIDITTLLHRDRTSHNYAAPRASARAKVLHADHSEDEDDSPPDRPNRRTGTTLVMAAPEYTPRQGRWTIPKDIPQLTEDVEDIDWWFHRMQLHLDNCRIADRRERLDCLHTQHRRWFPISACSSVVTPRLSTGGSYTRMRIRTAFLSPIVLVRSLQCRNYSGSLTPWQARRSIQRKRGTKCIASLSATTRKQSVRPDHCCRNRRLHDISFQRFNRSFVTA